MSVNGTGGQGKRLKARVPERQGKGMDGKEKRLLLDILLNTAEANTKAARNCLPEFEKRLMEEEKARTRLYVLFALACVAFSLSFARLICLILTYR